MFNIYNPIDIFLIYQDYISADESMPILSANLKNLSLLSSSSSIHEQRSIARRGGRRRNTPCIIKKTNFSIRTPKGVNLVSKYNDPSSSQRAPVKSSMSLNGQLGYYLAGILEGDGTVIVPKYDNTNKNVPSIYISFHINDLEFAKILISVLGYGTIQK